MTDFFKIANSIVVHFAHICAYGIETVNSLSTLWGDNLLTFGCFYKNIHTPVSSRCLHFSC